MRAFAVVVTLLGACGSKESPPRGASEVTAPPTPTASPSTKTAFAVGDNVVLYPTGVMTITAIDTRKKLTPPGMDSVAFEPANALEGKDTMTPVTNDKLVYALRFVGEARDSFLLDVDATTRPPLRRVSTPAQIDAFLAVLRETAATARKPGAAKPADLHRALPVAGNELPALARLYPYLDPEEYSMERRILAHGFVQEVAIAKGIDEVAAKALVEKALGSQIPPS
jgi:RNA polymerase-interacting CarD/CdnL/TRCF family regulator